MRYKNRKHLQRKLNKIVKNMNEAIVQDNLWRGRFELRQMESSYYPYEDGSGGELVVRLRALDKKTNEFCDYFMEYFNSSTFGPYKVSRIMNDFIVEYCKVWEVDGRESLYNDNVDYTKISSNYQSYIKPDFSRYRRV